MKAERIFVPECSNTMEAMEQVLAKRPLPEGSFLLTEFQQGGEGQEGAVWESEPGRNLLVTFVYYPSFLEAAAQFMFSKAVSLAVYDTLRAVLPEASIRIKWPNDLFLGEHKVAGILMRNQVSGERMGRTLIGLGLNVNQEAFPDHLPGAISLKGYDGRERSTHTLLDHLREMLDRYYDLLQVGEWDYLDELYLQRLYRIGVRGGYVVRGELVEARITGVDAFGRLLLEDGERHWVCAMKEVVYL
ncbi:MAG TPA: biotin--[acetyl-CoA-carboxylase] ligase [Bacteroidales bacterium]|nr:biotin--[acetyl-CoA-carboxylase] ligase [Bacteroidales bacterium]HRZ76391.1 biotin--[acetyl-CoA-carboxylase] ligase [Bacteroidales bacterium]